VGSGSAGIERVGLLLAAALGLGAAVATSWLLARGTRVLSHRAVFRLSEILLLLVAAAMLAHAVDRLIALDWLPPLADPVWDSSQWLADDQGPGRLLADLAGYRARPSGTLLLGLALFWAMSVAALARSRPCPARA